MPRKESINEKIERVRPPRVHIKYEVELDGAIEMKELPFVVGVLGDFSGHVDPDNPLPAMRDRKFVQIDRDNFDEALKGMAPRLAFSVDNKLENDGSKIGVKLNFKKLDDFTPDELVKQVEPLERLVKLRQNLSDLKTKAIDNDKVGGLLEDILSNPESQKQLGAELGIEPSGGKGKEEK